MESRLELCRMGMGVGVCVRTTGARISVVGPPDCPLTEPESHTDSQMIGYTVRGDRRVGCDVTV